MDIKYQHWDLNTKNQMGDNRVFSWFQLFSIVPVILKSQNYYYFILHILEQEFPFNMQKKSAYLRQYLPISPKKSQAPNSNFCLIMEKYPFFASYNNRDTIWDMSQTCLKHVSHIKWSWDMFKREKVTETCLWCLHYKHVCI